MPAATPFGARPASRVPAPNVPAATPFQSSAPAPPAATPFDRARPPSGAARQAMRASVRELYHGQGESPRLSLERFAWLTAQESAGEPQFSRALWQCNITGAAQWQQWKTYWAGILERDAGERDRFERLLAHYQPPR
ncbi:MAG: hypothetical protein KC731_04185 [Myxococcales bacterium]|nr:hypothetical protein [Myxococcales bacterium]